MKTHITKKEFKAIEVLVIALHFFSALVFIASILVPIFFYNGEILGGKYIDPVTTSLYSLGGLFMALILFSASELLQIFMKMEYNLEEIRGTLARNTKKKIDDTIKKTTKSISNKSSKRPRASKSPTKRKK